ncbi:MAG: lanthionine synthetase LanC family protein [Bacteroidota bacterium]
MNDTLTTTDTQQFVDTAFEIGSYLAREAIWDGDSCNWLGTGLEVINEQYQIAHKTFLTDVYNGTAGIAFFLAHLYQETKDEIIKETLEGAVNQILNSEDKLPSNYSYFGGKLGVASTLITIGDLMNRKDWSKVGWDQLFLICSKDIQDFEIDLIGGVAGAIPVLLKHYLQSGNQVILKAAVRCGNFLIEKANKSTGSSWSWSAMEGQQGLTGYSHGAAGMALALLELYHVTKDNSYYTAAMYGFNYERQHYKPQQQNWPDLRDQGGAAPGAPVTCGDAWCHGAPGIALSRLRAFEITGDASFRQEAEVALMTTHRGVYGGLTNHNQATNFSLCHGLAGNADILITGGQRLGKSEYLQVAQQVGTLGINRYGNTGLAWPSGVNDPTGASPGMDFTPGLLLGIAGTGYFYLRLARPEKYKSIMLL